MVVRLLSGRFGVVRVGVVGVLWSRLRAHATVVRSGLLNAAVIDAISKQAVVAGHQVRWQHQVSCQNSNPFPGHLPSDSAYDTRR